MCRIFRCQGLSLWLVGALVGAVLAGSVPCEVSAAPTIRFKKSGLDRLKFHGRVKLLPPQLGGPIDPVIEGFGVELVNEHGLFFRAHLFEGDLEARPGMHYRFKDRAARRGEGSRAGLYQVLTRFREYEDGWYYTVRILAYASLGAAIEPLMSVIFYRVDGPASVTAEWVRKQYGWRLPLDRF